MTRLMTWLRLLLDQIHTNLWEILQLTITANLYIALQLFLLWKGTVAKFFVESNLLDVLDHEVSL